MMQNNGPDGAVLLIATVGGTPEAVAASLIANRPARTAFVVSPQSQEQIEAVLRLARESAGHAGAHLALGPGQWDPWLVEDAQDFARCVEALRRRSEEVLGWVARGDDYRVVVDITGGTKCMSAALALVAHRWPCVFSYVGGTERTKDGQGVVVSGREQVVHTHNPWDALGYQTVEDALVLFDHGDYGGAIAILRAAEGRTRDVVKQSLAALRELAQVYQEWDWFEHEKALRHLGRVRQRWNDIVEVIGERSARSLRSVLDGHERWLRQLGPAGVPSRRLVEDLLGNALRRGREGRFDDAVARLYRATEALAQVRLAEQYGISTDQVPLAKLPDALHREWSARARDGSIAIGLQDAYRLLGEWHDEVGLKFAQMRLSGGRDTVLANRNRSILAHGFGPVGENTYRQFRDACLTLAGVREEDLPVFPRLSRATALRD